MKTLVFAHRLEVGGTQVNAIELTAALRDLHGHQVELFATPGPMLELAHAKSLPFHPAPDATMHPSPGRMRALDDVVRSVRPDVIHVWDWPQCLDAYYSVYLSKRVPMVVTSMGMVVDRMLPKAVTTTFGTPELVEKAIASGRRDVKLILPPVDIHWNDNAAVDGQHFRSEHGFSDQDVVLVAVSRLTSWMKAEGLRDTIEAVRVLGRDMPINFVIVGDGTSRAELENLARQTNAELGRTAIVLTGALLDPRPTYAAADIVVGMGGSALRGLSFGKPLLVVGERGFSAPFNRDTEGFFYHKGLYGLGDGNPGAERLIANVREMVAGADQFAELGAFGRHFIERHYSLEAVSAELDRICRTVAQAKPRVHEVAVDGIRTASVIATQKLFPSRFRRILRL